MISTSSSPAILSSALSWISCLTLLTVDVQLSHGFSLDLIFGNWYSTPICEKAKEFLKVSTSKEYVEVDGEQKRVCMTKNQGERTMICVDEDQGINDTIPQDIPCCFSLSHSLIAKMTNVL